MVIPQVPSLMLALKKSARCLLYIGGRLIVNARSMKMQRGTLKGQYKITGEDDLNPYKYQLFFDGWNIGGR